MHHHRVIRAFPYPPELLFEIVGDVARYPEFVPWITHMLVRNPRTESDGVSVIDTEAAVGFSFLKERFATRVRRDPKALLIEVSLIRGPFKALRNCWKFEPHLTGTRVIFEIDFAFKSRILDALLAANFDRAVDKLINCFDARARALSGEADPIVA